MSDSDSTVQVDDRILIARLNALRGVASALGMAIKGASSLANAVEAAAITKALSDQLLMISKRISWVEKVADPSWTPYDPENNKKRGAAARNRS